MAREPYQLTVNDVARMLGGWHPMTVYAKARKGELPSHKVGSALRFDRDEIEAWKEHNDAVSLEKRTESQKKWTEQLAAQRALQESRRRKNQPTPAPTPEPQAKNLRKSR